MQLWFHHRKRVLKGFTDKPGETTQYSDLDDCDLDVTMCSVTSLSMITLHTGGDKRYCVLEIFVYYVLHIKNSQATHGRLLMCASSTKMSQQHCATSAISWYS